MPHELAGITTCNLPHEKLKGQICGTKFAGPQHLIVGQQGGGRLQTLLGKLAQHLYEHHREYFAQIQIQGEQLKGVLMMGAFKTTDAELEAQRNYCRWQVHQQTLGARIDDENLGLAAAAIAKAVIKEFQTVTEPDGPRRAWEFELIISREIEIALRAVRDAIQEPAEPPNPLAPVAVEH